jgi:2-amino-4-hydroxy-6-hydroxymethyldihydropteridine diphosphokinase
MEEDIFLGLGSDTGDRSKNLENAVNKIRSGIGNIISISGIYETEPWGFESENRFLNLVVRAKTELTPGRLLERTAAIEQELGRIRRNERYSSRTIDIDILLYGDRIIEVPGLIIPHPLIQERRFVLVPLCELIPEAVHPVLRKKFSVLLEECRDRGEVNIFKSAHYLRNCNNPFLK